MPDIVPVLDPDLEGIRANGVPSRPNIKAYLESWLAHSGNYSMRKLTTESRTGWNILHKIAYRIDGTPVGANGDWKQLAGYLGLNIYDINRIENFSNIKGATLEVFGVWAIQGREPTLSKLLEALQHLDRQDVLLAIKEDIEELLNPSASSVSKDGEMDSGMEMNVSGEADPANLESCPLEKAAEACHAYNKNDDKCMEKKKPVKKVVLLTFAQDGYQMAKQVARQIRSLNLGLGVLILEENKEQLEFSGECIYRWYYEVDYIIPIITEEYLWQIAPANNTTEDLNLSEPTCVDARYARLLYVMMLQEFQRDRCLNYRVRPIESNLGTKFNAYRFLLQSPMFSCRRKSNQVCELANSLALSRRRPPQTISS